MRLTSTPAGCIPTRTDCGWGTTTAHAAGYGQSQPACGASRSLALPHTTRALGPGGGGVVTPPPTPTASALADSATGRPGVPLRAKPLNLHDHPPSTSCPVSPA